MKIFYVYREPGMFWFRFFQKWGLCVTDLSLVAPSFSQRNGIGGRRVGRWFVEWLS